MLTILRVHDPLELIYEMGHELSYDASHNANTQWTEISIEGPRDYAIGLIDLWTRWPRDIEVLATS